MISNGSTQINGTSQRANNSSTSKNGGTSGGGAAKPARRHTVMAVNGQLPHTNGL